MSFSTEVKNELLSLENTPCCELAQNYALLLFGRSFSASSLSLLIENEGVAVRYAKAVESLSGDGAAIEKTAAGNYKINVDNPGTLKKTFAALGLNEKNIKRRINFANIENSCCFQAFIRGAFLVSGTVTNPEKEYHLEFSVSTKGLCDDLVKLFDEFEPSPKVAMRGGTYIVYFKNSGDIEDVLALTGAMENSLELMGTKIFKDIRNTVNRKVNFENANIARAIKAAAKQYEAINYLKQSVGFEALPKELKAIAEIRYKDRQLSNAEIARLLPESITVSGVNHRFQRLIKLADEAKKSKKV